MRIPRIYFPNLLESQQTVILTDANYQHVCTVLRLKPGAPLILFNGTGTDYQGTLISLNKRRAEVKILETIPVKNESPLKLKLAQGISRPAKMDLVIQKSVELGCNEIFPLLTQHCDIKQDPTLLQKRLAHWQGIVISACEQCGRSIIPIIHPAQTLTNWIAQTDPKETHLILDPTVSQTFADLASSNTAINVLIGPEGGFNVDEVKDTLQNNFIPVRLGNRILRTETATIAALSILQHRVGDLG